MSFFFDFLEIRTFWTDAIAYRGVMDVVVKTDFPDIMSKCLIHSKSAGSIMVIPREVSFLIVSEKLDCR